MYFHIYQFPHNALMNVLKSMDMLSLVCISLCSKRSKSLIKSLSLKVRRANLFLLSDQFEIQTETGNQDRLEFRASGSSDTVSVFRQIIDTQIEQNIDVEYPRTSFGKLFNHLMDIFHHKTVNFLICSPTNLANIQSIKNAFEHVEIKKVTDFDSNFSFDFIEMFPQTKELILDEIVGVVTLESPRYKKLLMRNFDYLLLGECFPVNLTALLSINCAVLVLLCRTLTDKDINRFIKCWIKGSNPRLEHFRLYFWGFDDGVVSQEEEIMKNIPHKKVPMDQKRIFKLSIDDEHHPNRRAEINGGIDIIRKDGTKATISINPKVFQKCFQMFVW